MDIGLPPPEPPAPVAEPSAKPQEDLRTKALRRAREAEEAEKAKSTLTGSPDWYQKLIDDSDGSEMRGVVVTSSPYLMEPRSFALDPNARMSHVAELNQRIDALYDKLTMLGVIAGDDALQSTTRKVVITSKLDIQRKAAPGGTLRRVWTDQALTNAGSHLYAEFDTPHGLRGFGALLHQRMDAQAVIHELRRLADSMERNLDV